MNLHTKKYMSNKNSVYFSYSTYKCYYTFKINLVEIIKLIVLLYSFF